MIGFTAISCFACQTINRRRNHLFECSFNCKNDADSFHLEIKKISEQKYADSNGKNVVEDSISPGSFYSVCLVKEDEEDIYLDFYNLHDRHPKVKKIEVHYNDDNGSILFPSSNHDNYSEFYYIVEYNYLYLVFKGD